MREWFEAIPDSVKDAPGGDGEPFEWDEVADIVKDFVDDKVSERWRRNAKPYEPTPTFDPDDDSDGGLGFTMLGEMVDKVIPKQYGLVNGLYRKMIGMIYSPDGLGKTVATLYGVFCQIVGREFSDFTEERPAGLGPVRVLYVECEDGQEEAIDRLQKLLGGTYRRTLADGPEETYSYSMGDFDQYERAIIRNSFAVISEARLLGADGKTAESLDLSNPRHMFALRRAVRAGRFDLVIIDVMKQAFPKVDENNNTDVQVKIIDPLKVMVQDENIGALVIHHANGQGNARGATSFKGATRYRRKLSVLMEPDPDNPEQKIPRLDGAFRWNLEKDKRSLKKKLEYLRIDSREDGSLAVVIEDPNNIRIQTRPKGEEHADRAYAYLKANSPNIFGAKEIKTGANLTDRNWKDALPILRTMPDVKVLTVNGNEAYQVLFPAQPQIPDIPVDVVSTEDCSVR